MQLCSKCTTQVTCIKNEYNFLNVLQAKDMYRAAFVKNNAKFSCFVSSCRNMSHCASTVCRIILPLTLLPLSSGRQLMTNVSFGVSKLPIRTLIYFRLATSASSTIKKIRLSKSNSRICSSFFFMLI